MRLPRAAATIAVLLAAGTAASEEPAPPSRRAARARALTAAEDPTFRPGQLWRYHARPLEQRSRLVVCRVDSAPGIGTVVHVQFKGIRMRRRASALGYLTIAHHVPVTRAALVMSVTELERTDEPCVDFEAPYREWRRRFLSASGDRVFTVPVAEALDAIERSSRSGNATPSP